MDGQKARKLNLAAPSMIITSLCVTLAGSLGLNLWQYGIIKGQRSFDTPLKATVAAAETKQQEVQPRRKIASDVANQRFDQLYREIENLSRLSDQVLDVGQRPSITPRTGDQLVKPAGVP